MKPQIVPWEGGGFLVRDCEGGLVGWYGSKTKARAATVAHEPDATAIRWLAHTLAFIQAALLSAAVSAPAPSA